MSAYETADDDRTEKESSPYEASIVSEFSRDATPTGEENFNPTPRETTPFEDVSESVGTSPVTLAKGDYYSLKTSESLEHGKTILMRLGTAMVTDLLERFAGVIWEILE